MRSLLLAGAWVLLLTGVASASGTRDLQLIHVTDEVWAIVGPLTNRTPENYGNNATFGFVVTDEGIVVIDSGGTREGARDIHRLIRSVSDRPIRYVINTGGQDHRWLGNDYFSGLGAEIISSKEARKDQNARLNLQWTRLVSLIGDEAISGTEERYADIVFDEDFRFTLGGIDFEIHHRGPAHTPGDSFVWLPAQGVVFTGDIVYTERMLSVGEQSDSRSWLHAFESLAALKPGHVVPGHGSPTTLEVARADTYEYLVFLRDSVAAFMDEGGEASELARIDQSRFEYLQNFETLSGRNALKVYTELEWE